jgi:hypothetical protein
MIIVYTHHAQQRMVQRKITQKQVEETLDSPDELMFGEQGEEISIKHFGVREVRVVYQEIDDRIVVYTVIRKIIR